LSQHVRPLSIKSAQAHVDIYRSANTTLIGHVLLARIAAQSRSMPMPDSPTDLERYPVRHYPGAATPSAVAAVV